MRFDSSLLGILVWTPRYFEQALPDDAGNIQSTLEWPAGRLLWSITPLTLTCYTSDHLSQELTLSPLSVTQTTSSVTLVTRPSSSGVYVSTA